MDLYAIEILRQDLPLITLLNQGVTPQIEAKPTWFVFDATWNSEVPNQIVSEEELLKRDAFEYATRPTIYRIK